MSIEHIHTKQGISLFEVIVAVSIISVILISVVSALQAFLRAGLSAPERVQAIMLAEEGLEAIRFLRDQDWDTNMAVLTDGTAYHLIFNGTSWEATTTPQIIAEVFTRIVSVEDVYRRDSDDDIVASTSPEVKTLDPGTKLVTVSVSWNAGATGTSTKALTSYFSDLVE